MHHKALKSFWATIIFSMVLLNCINFTLAQQAPPVPHSLTVSTTVGETAIIFEGLTSPNSYIVFLIDDIVVGTTSSNDNGQFTKRLGNLVTGLQKVKVFVTDKQGHDSSTVKFELYLAPHVDSTVSNVVLPPTIDIEKNKITRDERIRIRGHAAPKSLVTLFFFNDKRIKSQYADLDGSWTITLNGKDFPAKKYKLYAKVFTKDGYKSSESNDLVLEILPGKNDEVSQDLTDFAKIIPQEIVCSLPEYFTPFDFDSSCQISYNEFLILVREWYDGWIQEEQCDVDNDNDCDLVDFSVVMYYVNR